MAKIVTKGGIIKEIGELPQYDDKILSIDEIYEDHYKKIKQTKKHMNLGVLIFGVFALISLITNDGISLVMSVVCMVGVCVVINTDMNDVNNQARFRLLEHYMVAIYNKNDKSRKRTK